MIPSEIPFWSSLKIKLGGMWDWEGRMVRMDSAPWWPSPPASAKPHPLPRTDRMPVLLALPMKFSAKQVYLPSSDRLMFLMINVPSGVTVTL